ncbi:MAG: ABC transporter permease [Haloechinothrix sp.]
MTSSPNAKHPARAVRLIAQRELNTRLRTRSFVIGTVVIIAVMTGYFLLQATIFGEAGRSAVGLSGQATNLAEPIKNAAGALGKEVQTSVVDDRAEAESLIRSGELDAVVFGNAAEPRVLVKSDVDPGLHAAVQGISQQEVLRAKLAQAGVDDPAAVLDEAATVDVAVTTLEANDPERGQRLVIGLIMAALLFMSISSYGALVAQGVVEEKTSRVVEILLATVRPWQLLLGKVIGLGLVGLAQMVIIAGVGVVMAAATGVLTLSGVAVGTLAWGVLWYVLGFFLYATIYGSAGSLVSRQEDAPSVLTPVTLTLMIGFVVGLNLMLQDPDSSASATLSMIPLLAPILMPGRIAAGGVAGWEIGLAIVLTLGTLAACTWLGGRVYQNAVLRSGSRMKLVEALRG